MATDFDLDLDVTHAGPFVTLTAELWLIVESPDRVIRRLREIARHHEASSGRHRVLAEIEGDCLYASIPIQLIHRDPERIVTRLRERVIAAFRSSQGLDRAPSVQTYKLDVGDGLVRQY